MSEAAGKAHRSATKSVTLAIRDRALSLGFDAVGFCDAELPEDARTRLVAFIEAGYHGSMGWLADRTAQRSQPNCLWPDVQSVIVVGLNYAPDTNPLENLAKRSTGNVSVYARNRDYHQVLKGRLKHLAQFASRVLHCDVKVFVDTAPIMEKPLARWEALSLPTLDLKAPWHGYPLSEWTDEISRKPSLQ